MAANYDLPDVVEKRVRFFDGQFLQDQDFVDEQKYHLDRLRRHHKLLHLPGVVEGLVAAPAGANTVMVGPGTAIDSDGRQLVLAQAVRVDLPDARFANMRGIRIYLTYGESPVDRQSDEGGDSDTRWQERPQVVLVAPAETYSGSVPPVLLAEATMDDKGTVTVDGSVRQYSGVRLPGPGPDAPGIRAGSAGSVGLAGSLTIDGNLGIGASNPRARLDVQQADRSGTHPAAVRGLYVTGDFSPAANGVEFRHSNASQGLGFGYNSLYAAGTNADQHLNLMPKGTGGVGVGTTTPRAKLEVAGAGGTSVDLIVSGRLRSSPDNGGLWVGEDRFVGGNAKGQIGFYSGNAWRLSVLDDGSVGIGTAKPRARLEVVGAGGRSVDLVVSGQLRSASDEGGLWISEDRLMGGHSRDQIGLWNGGDWRLSVSKNGNVGIGTTDPGARLDVMAPDVAGASGWCEAVQLSRKDNSAIIHPGGGLLFGLHGDRNFYFGDIAGGKLKKYVMQIEADTGNVGIGTSNPGARLDVAGGGGASVDLVVNGRLRSNNDNGGLWVSQDRFVGGHSTNQVGFYNGNAWRLTVLNNGNVGIGNTDPGMKLTVSGPSNHLQLRREGAGSAGGAQLFLELVQPDAPPLQVDEVHPCIRFHHGSRFWHRIEAQGDGFHFKTGDLGSDNYVDVKANNIFSTGQIYFQPGTDWGFDDKFGAHTQRYWYIFRPSWNLNDFSTGSPVLRASGMAFPSDVRFKDRISVIPDALGKLSRLRGVSFVWNDLGVKHLTSEIETTVTAGPDATKEENESLWQELRERSAAKLGPTIGLVAQDVEQVVPELVHTDADGYKLVDYSRISALLVEAVKEQQSLIRELTRRIAVLEGAAMD